MSERMSERPNEPGGPSRALEACHAIRRAMQGRGGAPLPPALMGPVMAAMAASVEAAPDGPPGAGWLVAWQEQGEPVRRRHFDGEAEARAFAEDRSYWPSCSVCLFDPSGMPAPFEARPLGRSEEGGGA